MIKFIQITTIKGTVYQTKVNSLSEFKKLKRKAFRRVGKFFELCETCSIRKNEILSVEYFVVSEGESQ